MENRGYGGLMIAILIFVGYGVWWFANSGPNKRFLPKVIGEGIECSMLPPQVRTIEEPLQSEVPSGMGEVKFRTFVATPMAGYSIRARVLSRENYKNEYAPVDLLLGWGQMSEDRYVREFSFRQSGRFGYWRTESNEIASDMGKINRQIANTHFIPANEAVARDLDAIREGDFVQFEGWLVNVKRNDGATIRTSLTRNDTGAGACEVVLVCAIKQQYTY